jgi:hypothetical protein
MEGPPPAQQQRPSGSEAAMQPRPKAVDERHVGSGKLHNKARDAATHTLSRIAADAL